MLPPIHNRSHNHKISLKIFTENPQQLNRIPSLKHQSLKETPYSNLKLKSNRHLILQTDLLIQQMQQDDRQNDRESKIKTITRKRKQGIRSRNHEQLRTHNQKLIYENYTDFRRPSNRMLTENHSDLSDIKDVSRIVRYRTKSCLQEDAPQKPKRVSQATNVRHLKLQNDLNALRKIGRKNQHILSPQQSTSTTINSRKRTRQKQLYFTQQQKTQQYLQYETMYYRKLKQQCWQGNTKQLVSKNKYFLANKTKSEQYSIHFPELSQVIQLITTYQPLTPDLNLDLIQKSGKRFYREYRNNEHEKFLYFGEHDTLGQRSGKGVLVTSNKILQGVWEKGEISKGAELQKKFLYQGEFYKFKKHGKGSYESVSGEKYNGQWRNNKRHGYGIWFSDNGEHYDGTWAYGKAEGIGTYKDMHGNKYNGQFKNYLKSGKGKQEFVNGDYFEGVFSEGYPHGKGTYRWECKMKYQGRFVNGIRQGYGRLSKQDLFCFNGRFQNEKPVVSENCISFEKKPTSKSFIETEIQVPRRQKSYKSGLRFQKLESPQSPSSSQRQIFS